MTAPETRTVMLYGDDIGRVDYVAHMGTDLTVVNSARVSFNRSAEEMTPRDAKLIKYLLGGRKDGTRAKPHTSTLEHCVATLRFKVPLYVRTHHIRHRTGSYNEVSRRYTEENIEFYLPKTFRKQSENNRQASVEVADFNPTVYTAVKAADLMESRCVATLQVYKDMLAAGVPREQARGILPECTYTTYWCTMSLNNWLKFLGLRMPADSQWETQQAAAAAHKILKELWPVTVGAWEELNEAEV